MGTFWKIVCPTLTKIIYNRTILRKRQKISPMNYSPILTKIFSFWENWGKFFVFFITFSHDFCQRTHGSVFDTRSVVRYNINPQHRYFSMKISISLTAKFCVNFKLYRSVYFEISIFSRLFLNFVFLVTKCKKSLTFSELETLFYEQKHCINNINAQPM